MRRLFAIALGILIFALAGIGFLFGDLPREPPHSAPEEIALPAMREAEVLPIAPPLPATATSAAVSLPATPQTRERPTVPVSVPPASAPVIPTLPPAVLRPLRDLPVPAGTEAPVVAPPATSTPVSPGKPPLPPLSLDAIFAAVVKIECPSEDRRGKYVASGFVLPYQTPDGSAPVVTAAHFLMASGSDACAVIFPDKEQAPAHYFTGMIREDRAEIRRRHDEEGIDVAFIMLPALSDSPEARAVFLDAYPSVPYPICADPDMVGDALLHFGYPSNFLHQSYLSKTDGAAIAYADIKGIETLLNEDQTATYKSPIFSYVTDRRNLHPYMVSRVPTFYGDSGGLAFNAAKQCILGPHRGGTIGGGAGENVSVFPLLGWPAAQRLLP
ncbi:MAG: hypothetical protein AAB533_01785 [Patescibacteria group bacterium]